MSERKKRMKELEQGENLMLTRKKHPKKGIVSVFLGVISFLLLVILCIAAGNERGSLSITAGFLGSLSLILALIGLVLAYLAGREPDIKFLFPTIGGLINVCMAIGLILLYVWGFSM
jgi:hypothetical protein